MATTVPKITGVVAEGSPSTLYAYTGTYASLPAASGYAAGTQALVTDVGINGSMFFSDGVSRWLPVNGRCNLFTLPYPVGIAPTFTGTTNGAITFGTAVGATVQKGWFYYPANSLVASHAAGFYWTEMSSTTAAVVYNNLYTPAAGTIPNEPTSKTAFSGAVPGGTGSTGFIVGLYVAIPGGVLGEIGSVLSDMLIECNSTTGAKYATAQLGGQNLSAYNFASSSGGHGSHIIKNYGTSRQRGATSNLNTLVTAPTTTSAVDTSSTQNYSVELAHNGAATDVVIVSALSIDLVIPR